MVSDNPTLRQINIEVYGAYTGSKTFKDCQNDAPNKTYFTASNPINSMRSWGGYSNKATITYVVRIINALIQGITMADGKLQVTIDSTHFEIPFSAMTRMESGNDLRYHVQVTVEPEPTLLEVVVSGIKFNNGYILKVGGCRHINPDSIGFVGYTNGIASFHIDDLITDAIDPDTETVFTINNIKF